MLGLEPVPIQDTSDAGLYLSYRTRQNFCVRVSEERNVEANQHLNIKC